MNDDFITSFLTEKWNQAEWVENDKKYIFKYVKTKEEKTFLRYIILRGDKNVNYFTNHTGLALPYTQRVKLVYLLDSLESERKHLIETGDIENFWLLEKGKLKIKKKKST